MATIPGESFDAAGRHHAPGIHRPRDMTPETYKLPTLAATKSLTQAELMTVSQRYGFSLSDTEYRADAAAYVKQFSKIPQGSKNYWAEVDRITSPDGGRAGALKAARRAQRRYQTIAAQNGNPNQVMIRIGEGDEDMCGGCEDLEGTEGTLAEQREAGLPGRQECGENCRCTMSATSGSPSADNSWLLNPEQSIQVLKDILAA